jgi:hypothetical protein
VLVAVVVLKARIAFLLLLAALALTALSLWNFTLRRKHAK